MTTSIIKNKARELEMFIKKATQKLIEFESLQSDFSISRISKIKNDNLTKLSEKSFAFWNNPKDTIYDYL